MKHRLLIVLLGMLCAAATAFCQNIRTLGYNTSNNQIVAATNLVWTNSFSFSTNTVTAQVRTNLALGWPALTNSNAATALLGVATNGQVIYGGTNTLTFTNNVNFGGGDLSISNQTIAGSGVSFSFENGAFDYGATIMRESLGFSTNLNALWTATNSSNARNAVGLGATWLTNDNVTNFRTAIGLGATNVVQFSGFRAGEDMSISNDGSIYWSGEPRYEPETQTFYSEIQFDSPLTASNTRNNLGLPLAALTNTSNVTLMRALSGSTNTNHPFSGSVSVVGTNNTNTLVFSNGILQEVQ